MAKITLERGDKIKFKDKSKPGWGIVISDTAFILVTENPSDGDHVYESTRQHMPPPEQPIWFTLIPEEEALPQPVLWIFMGVEVTAKALGEPQEP